MDLEAKVRDEVRIQMPEQEKEENQVEKGEFKQFDSINDSFFTDHRYYYRRLKKFSPETIERISREHDILKEGLPDSIFVRANKVKPDLLRAVIIGPQGTCYHDGLFFFDIYFPSEFPNERPKISYYYFTISMDFYIQLQCIPWSPSTSTLLEYLESIRIRQAYIAGAIYTKGISTLMHYELIQNCNWRAMVNVLNKPPKYFENFVARHFHDSAEKILTTCKAYINKRVNTIDGPMIKAPWQEEFDAMEKHYDKLVDAFQKNGSSLDHLSKLQIEFHGKPSQTMAEKIGLYGLLCISIVFFLIVAYCAVRQILQYFFKI